MSELDWPPTYTLHCRPRVKRVRVQICPRKGLQIIAPKRFNAKNAIKILTEHRSWIERTWKKVQPRIASNEAIPSPESIYLRAFDEMWQVQYVPLEIATLKIQTNQHVLVLKGNIHSSLLVKQVLQRWLIKRAQLLLTPQLNALSQQTHLSYSSVSFRNHSSRWGSCSANKKISLNCKLLFFPIQLMKHVLLHELCHTVYLNHSTYFWNLLKTHDPETLIWRKQLKNADNFVPLWLEK